MHPPAVPIALALLLAVPVLPVAALADDHDGARHGGRYERSHRFDNPYERHRHEGRVEDRRASGFHDRDGRHPGRYPRHDRYDDRGRYTRYERHDRYDRYVHRAGRRPYFYPLGHRFAALPRTRLRLVLGNGVYYYFDGVYLTPRRGAYVVVGAPVGIRVPFLPVGYVSFLLGPRRYFYVNATYYLGDDVHDDYVVVDPPAGAEDALAAVGEPFAEPPGGRAADLDVCHARAEAEAGPEAGWAPKGSKAHDDYLNALDACLRDRGYAVR